MAQPINIAVDKHDENSTVVLNGTVLYCTLLMVDADRFVVHMCWQTATTAARQLPITCHWQLLPLATFSLWTV